MTAVEGDTVILNPSSANPVPIRVPAGSVWLSGDNAENSTDSRRYGPVPIGLLRGRVIGKLDFQFPFIHSLPEKPAPSSSSSSTPSPSPLMSEDGRELVNSVSVVKSIETPAATSSGSNENRDSRNGSDKSQS